MLYPAAPSDAQVRAGTAASPSHRIDASGRSGPGATVGTGPAAAGPVAVDGQELAFFGGRDSKSEMGPLAHPLQKSTKIRGRLPHPPQKNILEEIPANFGSIFPLCDLHIKKEIYFGASPSHQKGRRRSTKISFTPPPISNLLPPHQKSKLQHKIARVWIGPGAKPR